MSFPTVQLREVADIERSSVSPKDIHGDERYVGLENVTSDGSLVDVTGAGCGVLKSNKFRFGPDHILYGKLRPYLAKIAQPGFHGICSTDILPIRPGPDVDVRYLLHFLRTPRMVAQADKNSSGANLPRLSPKALAAFEVPLPSIQEQRRIAAILDAADTVRAKRRQTVDKLDTLIQAIFIDRFVRTEKGWPFQTVEELARSGKDSIRTGPFGSQLLHEEFVDEGVAVLGIDNVVQNRFVWAKKRYITEEKYGQLARYTVRPGDVLVTIMGTCGRVAVVPSDVPRAINTKHLCCISLDNEHCLPTFLWACLRFHPAVLHQLGATHGAVMPGLNMGIIKRAEVPVPPLGEQRRFVDTAAAVKHQMTHTVTSDDQLGTLMRSLQQRAFAGDL